ncbi:MAG TPA: 30S ribosomal protein S4 [Bacteroidales bacterium]|nr:30S ribosomal protein S4 [Bacteroidales bacterium]
MARYIGPKSRIARRFRDPIFGPDKSYEKKNYPPGMHGQNKRRSKVSEYGTQLMEKQKAKYTYGILERQFRNTFLKAARKGGITGEVLLQLIESRLDNVVFRLGISPTRDGARQLIGHRHILVNGKIVNIPSMELRPGDLISVRERSKSLEVIINSLSGRGSQYPWLEWDSALMTGKFTSYPERDQIPENIKEQLIVELYSK